MCKKNARKICAKDADIDVILYECLAHILNLAKNIENSTNNILKIIKYF